MMNNVMIKTDDRRNVTITAIGNSYTSTLHFSYLTEDDNGLYTCAVKMPGTKQEIISQSLELGEFNSEFKVTL